MEFNHTWERGGLSQPPMKIPPKVLVYDNPALNNFASITRSEGGGMWSWL